MRIPTRLRLPGKKSRKNRQFEYSQGRACSFDNAQDELARPFYHFIVNIQAEKLEAAQTNLIHISISVSKVLQQLVELIKQQHIDDGSKE